MISTTVSLTVFIRSAPATTIRPPTKISPATIRKARAGTRVLESWIDGRTRRLRGTCACNIPPSVSLQRALRPGHQHVGFRGDGQQDDHDQRVLARRAQV